MTRSELHIRSVYLYGLTYAHKWEAVTHKENNVSSPPKVSWLPLLTSSRSPALLILGHSRLVYVFWSFM